MVAFPHGRSRFRGNCETTALTCCVEQHAAPYGTRSTTSPTRAATGRTSRYAAGVCSELTQYEEPGEKTASWLELEGSKRRPQRRTLAPLGDFLAIPTLGSGMNEQSERSLRLWYKGSFASRS
jgi:hypothetical protein